MTEDFKLIFARREANLRKASAINKTVVFDALAAANITTVTAEFDGEGDSGGITSHRRGQGRRERRLPGTEGALPGGRLERRDAARHRASA